MDRETTSAWDRMSYGELLEDAKRQHRHKLDAEIRAERAESALRKLRIRYKALKNEA